MAHRTHIRERGDEGTALTEFVIVAPLFVLLMYWSQFFTDLGTARLKVEEAARYASWEMTAQRPTGVVSTEVTDRFKDMRSVTDKDYGAKPYGMKAFRNVEVKVTQIDDMKDAAFDRGEVANGNTGGIVGAIMGFITRFLNKAAKAILRLYQFDTRGLADATVTATMQNAWIPKDGGWLYGAFFKPSGGDIPWQNITMTAKSAPLLVNVWKAWPGKYALSSQSLSTDPYDTYTRSTSNGPASAPEKELSARLKKVAFLSFVGSVLRPVGRVTSFLRLPDIASVDTFDVKKGKIDGPVIMLPGARQTKSWQPGYGLNTARIGTMYNSDTRAHINGVPAATPDETDHYRYTTPSYITSRWWTDDTGKTFNSRKATGYENNASQNPYVKMYACRDAFYLGSKTSELKRWKNDRWTQQAFQGCP